MKLLLVPINPKRWSQRDMRLAVEQARDAMRRIGKKMDIVRERKRFSLACEQIEGIALQETRAGAFSRQGLEAYAVMQLFPSNGNARLPFMGPTDIRNIKASLPSDISKRVSITGGLVAILDPFIDLYIPRENGKPKPRQSRRAATSDYSLCDIQWDDITRNPVLKRTHEQIRRALETGQPLGWVNFEMDDIESRLARHEIFTQALRDYVALKKRPTTTRIVQVPKKVVDRTALKSRETTWWYKLLQELMPFMLGLLPTPMKTIMVDEKRIVELPIEPVHVSIAFQDGSVSEPFPLLCLTPVEVPCGLPVIRAALISNRHFELDSEVDFCLLRNSEINDRLNVSIAEQERWAFEEARRLIQGFVHKKKGLELHLYHTGLEPAVIGTYRAIVESLRIPAIRGFLKVVPKLRRHNGYKDLQPWY